MNVIIMIAKSLNKKSSHCINKRKKCFLFHICVNYLPHGSFEAVLLISMVQKKRGKDEDLYPSLFNTHLPHSLSPCHSIFCLNSTSCPCRSCQSDASQSPTKRRVFDCGEKKINHKKNIFWSCVKLNNFIENEFVQFEPGGHPDAGRSSRCRESGPTTTTRTSGCHPTGNTGNKFNEYPKAVSEQHKNTHTNSEWGNPINTTIKCKFINLILQKKHYPWHLKMYLKCNGSFFLRPHLDLKIHPLH